MKRCSTLLLACTSLAVSGLPAAAADNAPRFTMEKTQDGFVRMDTHTGEMSFCQERGGQIVCRNAEGDDRTSLRAEIETLRHRVDALEKRLDHLEGMPGGQSEDLPSEQEFEKGLTYMDRFFRRFMGIMKDFQNEDEGAPLHSPPDAAPQPDGRSGADKPSMKL